MAAYAICSEFLNRTTGQDSIYFRDVLDRFHTEVPLKVALDTGNRVLSAYELAARQNRVLGCDIVKWLQCLAAKPDQNLEYINVDATVGVGRTLFLSLAASICGNEKLIAWSLADYDSVKTPFPHVTILDRDKAREEFMSDTPEKAILDQIKGGLSVGGDLYIGVKESSIINRSLVRDTAISVAKNFDQGAAQALIELAAVVSEPGHESAQAIFESFRKEAEKPQPNKSLLNTLWNGITALMPVGVNLSEIATKLVPLLT